MKGTMTVKLYLDIAKKDRKSAKNKLLFYSEIFSNVDVPHISETKQQTFKGTLKMFPFRNEK